MKDTTLNLIKRYAPALVFIVILVALLIAVLCGSLRYTLSPLAFSADVRKLSVFTCEIDGVGIGEISLPHTFTDLSPRTAVILYAEIDAAPNESLYIKTNFAPLRLYVDDKLVYECGQDGSYPAFFIDPPTIISTVQLPDADGTQRLRFEYLTPNQRALQLSAVPIGDEIALLAGEFHQSGFSFLFSIILIFMGVVMAAISLIITRHGTAGSPFLWLGLFAAATGVWVLGECDLTAFIIPYPLLLYVMAYTGLFTTAIPFLRYGQLVLEPHSKLTLRIMKTVLCVAVAAALALQLAGAVSLARSLFLFHILVPLAFIVFAACLIWEYARYHSARARRFALPILVISLSAVLELINYQIRFTEMLTLFFQLGILFFVISMGFLAGRFTSEAIQTSEAKLRLEAEVASVNRVLDLQREQYEAIAENAEAVRVQRHDLRHHLAVIKGYNNSGEKEKLNAYLEELTASISTSGERMLCENFAVNTVTLHYSALAENEGIKTSTQLIVPKEAGRVRDSDLCIIVGNLLENAIEACVKVTEGKRFIKLRSLVQNDMLVITMDNSFDGYYNEENEIVCSRKRDGRGIGLFSVLAVAKKYDGNARFEAQGNVFLSSVYVSLSEPRTPAESPHGEDMLR